MLASKLTDLGAQVRSRALGADLGRLAIGGEIAIALMTATISTAIGFEA